MAEGRHVRSLPDGHPISLIFAPYNAFDRAALPVFEEAQRQGMAIVAMSPGSGSASRPGPAPRAPGRRPIDGWHG